MEGRTEYELMLPTGGLPINSNWRAQNNVINADMGEDISTLGMRATALKLPVAYIAPTDVAATAQLSSTAMQLHSFDERYQCFAFIPSALATDAYMATLNSLLHPSVYRVLIAAATPQAIAQFFTHGCYTVSAVAVVAAECVLRMGDARCADRFSPYRNALNRAKSPKNADFTVLLDALYTQFTSNGCLPLFVRGLGAAICSISSLASYSYAHNACVVKTFLPSSLLQLFDAAVYSGIGYSFAQGASAIANTGTTKHFVKVRTQNILDIIAMEE